MYRNNVYQNNSEHLYHSLDDTYILLSTKQNGGLVVPSKLLVIIVKIGFNVLRNFSQSKTNKKILLLKSMSIINDNIIDKFKCGHGYEIITCTLNICFNITLFHKSIEFNNTIQIKNGYRGSFVIVG